MTDVREPGRPYLDFYAAHHVVPVNYERDQAFFARRAWLSATLGVPPALIRASDVLEFGPGTGDNALVTASWGPERYVLVDANPASVAALRERFPSGGSSVEIIESNVEDFVAEETFDVVIAENIIPGQIDPAAFLRRVAEFVRPGGVVIVTCLSAAGLVADACRHLLRPEIERRARSFESQVTLGASIVGSHLATLGSSTRSPEDWIVDNVLHKWSPRGVALFDPRLAVDTLVPIGFDVLGSSPRVGEDERWFKHIHESDVPYGDRLVARFDASVPGLLDHRVPLETRMPESDEAVSLVGELWDLRTTILEMDDYSSLQGFLERLSELGHMLPVESGATVAAIDDFCGPDGMAQVADGAPFPAWPAFRSWWGRGVIYVSFWRGVSSSVG